MKILVACEFSGAVRRAFRERGHDAWSCDLLTSEDGSPFHLQGDVLKWISGKPRLVSVLPPDPWDLLVAFPPCTHLAVSGARWFKDKLAEQREAIQFFIALANADIPRIAIENPVGIMSTHWRKPDQIIQPWQFGHGETKATCLWLKGLPKLVPTEIVSGRTPRVHFASPGPDRWKERSRTLPGIARAMSLQWSDPAQPQPELAGTWAARSGKD